MSSPINNINSNNSVNPTNVAEQMELALQAIEQGAGQGGNQSVNQATSSTTNSSQVADTSTQQTATTVPVADDSSDAVSGRSFGGKARTMGKVLGGHSKGGSSNTVADATDADYQQWLITQQAISYQQQQQMQVDQAIQQQNKNKVNPLGK